MAGGLFTVVLEKGEAETLKFIIRKRLTDPDVEAILLTLIDTISGDKRVYSTPPSERKKRAKK